MASKLKALLFFAALLLTPALSHAAIATPWNATSTDPGSISPNLINGNNPWLKITSTGTSTFSNGVNLLGGCFSINGVCVTGGGSTYTATYPVTLTGSAFGLAFSTTTQNFWSAFNNFTYGINAALSSSTNATTTGSLYLTGLLGTGGELALDANNRVYKGATTTAGTGLTYTGNAFNVNTSQNITTLSNLTGNGLVKTSGGTGALSIGTNGTDYTLLTAITCSAGQFLNAATAAGVLTCGTPSGTGSGLATSTPLSGSNLLVYSTSGAGSAYGVATTSATINNGLTGTLTTLGSGQTIGLATINAGVLGSVTNGVVPTSQATSTLYGTGIGGQVLAWINGVPTWTATSSIQNLSLTTTGSSGAATLVGNTLNIPQYAGTTYTGTFPISISGSAISFGGLSTSTSAVVGNIPYFSGVNTFANVATSTRTYSGPFTISGTLGYQVGGTNSTITWNGLATTSQPSSSNLLVSNGTAGVYGVATTSVTNGTGISFTGTAGALVGGSNLTITNSSPLSGLSALFPFSFSNPTLSWVGLATSSNISAGQALYATGANTFAGTATTTLVAGTNVSFSGGTPIVFGSSPVTINASASSGGKQLPTYVVAASGGDFTTIQGALDACGTGGGCWIQLVDSTYTQGATGLLFKGSNTHIIGRGIGTTTIAFTGATTYFKTNSAAGGYSNNSIEGINISGDGNTSSIVYNLSDMPHFELSRTTADNIGTWVRIDDTQNITFYDNIHDNQATTIKSFGVNASSTNPTNLNTYRNNFIGCNANCVSFQLSNGNGNIVENNAFEPSTVTGTVGIRIFDLPANDGVFENVFNNNYIEANGKGIEVAKSVGSGGGVQRNRFDNNTVEANTLDYVFPGAATSTVIASQTWVNNYDSNFSNPLTSFQGPVGIGTSTEMESLSITPFAFFGINPTAGVAQNAFVIGSSTKTLLKIDNAGTLTLGTTTAGCLNTSATGVVFAATCATGGGSPGGTATEFQYRSGASTFGAITSLYNSTLGAIGFGTTTLPTNPAALTVATTSSGAQIALSAGAGQNLWNFFNKNGAFFLATSSPTGATSTVSQLVISPNGKIGIGGDNLTAARIAIGNPDSNANINTAFGFVATNPGGDARIGATSGDHLTGITTGDGTTYGAVYAYNYASSVAENLVLGQFGGNVGVGTTTPEATFAVNPIAGSAKNQFLVGSTTATNFRIDNAGHVFAPNTTSASAAQTGYWCYTTTGEFVRDTAVCLVSALKFKKDIVDLASTYGLAAVMQMQPVTYFLKTPFGKDDARQQIGFVADWSEKVVPQLVTHDENGDVHGFNYEQYTAVLTKAVQEQQAEIEALGGGTKKTLTDNWQWAVIGILALWCLCLTVLLVRRKK